MNADDFIDKWSQSELKETASFQSFFDDLCRLVGHDPPSEYDSRGEFFTYEKHVAKASGRRGFADAWYKGKFAWEQKGKGKSLDAAYAQLLQYRADLENPPLLVVSDFERIVIRTNFSNAKVLVHEIRLEELSQKLSIIEGLFFDPDSLRPNDVGSSVRVPSPGLSIKLRIAEPVKVYSSYGLVNHMGGPCPPLEGRLSLGMILQNCGRRSAKSIKVDIEIRLLEHTRRQCSRAVYIPSPNWHTLEEDGHFRFDGTSDEVCLGRDELPLGVVRFWFAVQKGSEDFADMRNDGSTPLDERVLESPILSGLGGHNRERVYQERILGLYQRRPAEDTYEIGCRVRAEGFVPSEMEARLSVFWSNHDIPDLSVFGKQGNRFNFNDYADAASIEELKAALLEEVPLGSHACVLLGFLADNNLPDAPGDRIGYGVNNSLHTHDGITVVSKPRLSNSTRVISFLFDGNANLKDIAVEFFPGTLVRS